jgi:hypothetical protein
MIDKDYESIKSMLIQVINKQNDMDDTLREMEKTLTQLNQTVVGNPTYGQKGLVAELEDVKIYVEKDKMIKNKIVGGLVIIGIVWTAAIEYFLNLFNKK